MKRIIVANSDFEVGQSLDLTGEKYHYLARVLRCRTGDRIMVGNGKGNFYFADLTFMDRDKITINVREEVKVVWEDRIHTTIIQSIPKGNKIDMIICGTTDLGVGSILPVISKRTLTRFKGDKLLEKNRRLRRIAEEAARQCGRPSLPFVGDIKGFAEVIEEFRSKEDTLKLIFWEAEERFGIYEALRKSSPNISSVVMAIGPEGGWAEEEVALAQKAGFQSVRFGHGILRVEIAAISFLSIIKFYFNMTEQVFWCQHSGSDSSADRKEECSHDKKGGAVDCRQWNAGREWKIADQQGDDGGKESIRELGLDMVEMIAGGKGGGEDRRI